MDIVWGGCVIAPVLALIAWTFGMWFWMYATRIPAMRALKVDVAERSRSGAPLVLLPKVARVAEFFSMLAEEIREVWVVLGGPYRQARWRAAVDVVEDFADEVWMGNVGDDPELSAAERAEGDVDFEDALRALRPRERCGGRIGAVGEGFCEVLAARLRMS